MSCPPLTLEQLSSRDAGGQQTMIDLTGSLWSTETILTVDVTADNPSRIDVVSALPNAQEITVKNATVAPGKGVLLILNTVGNQFASTEIIRMRVVGSEAFQRNYDLIQPVVVAVNC